MSKKPELLIPAGNIDVLKTAVLYGADAVYIGGEKMSLRANAANFTGDEMRAGIAYAHEKGVKVYVAVNAFIKENMLPETRDYLLTLADICPDGLIISDPGVFTLAREICSKIPVHISTQTSSLNSGTFNFWHNLGASRVVAARELRLLDIARIRNEIPPDMEIEAFVHGAMCISYSGRCLLSSVLAARGANEGDCTHPCRWKYALVEEKRPGEYFPIGEDEGGSYIMNSRDLCMVDHIPELVRAGVDSFKVEGRMKGQLYAAAVARTYRTAIDDFFESEEKYRRNIPKYLDQISRCTVRKFCTGFFFGQPDKNSQEYGRASYSTNYTFIGCVDKIENGEALFVQKNKFSVGETIEIMKPGGDDIQAQVLRITDELGNEMENAPHGKQKLRVEFSIQPEEGNILRREEKTSKD